MENGITFDGAIGVSAGDVFVIRPDAPLPVGRTENDPTKLVTAYSLGRFAALRQLDALHAFL